MSSDKKEQKIINEVPTSCDLGSLTLQEIIEKLPEGYFDFNAYFSETTLRNRRFESIPNIPEIIDPHLNRYFHNLSLTEIAIYSFLVVFTVTAIAAVVVGTLGLGGVAGIGIAGTAAIATIASGAGGAVLASAIAFGIAFFSSINPRDELTMEKTLKLN
jgi:hypothetical protein